jgi:hypothetical protein
LLLLLKKKKRVCCLYLSSLFVCVVRFEWLCVVKTAQVGIWVLTFHLLCLWDLFLSEGHVINGSVNCEAVL